MKTALYRNSTIHLDQINREDFQRFYERGKKGQLSCPVCHEKVRLFLGISTVPHFYHVMNQEASCEDLIQIAEFHQKSAPEFIERNGFRIPASRSINAVKTEASSFKQTQLLTVSLPFKPAPVQSFTQQDNYLQKLAADGFGLDGNQTEAVTYTDGPLLVLAGAGSGKTRVLTTRTAYMLQEKLIDAKTVMLVTFTAKAAAEMKARMLAYPQLNGSQIRQLVAGTFHSIFYRILSFHFPEKWSSDKLINREWQRVQMIKEAGKQLQLDEKEFAFDLALQQIGFWKNSMVLPEKVKPATAWEEKVSLLYKSYEQTKQQRQLFDFDDMLIGCNHLFNENQLLLEKYQNRFQYFLIDEFQDINKVQYELIKKLSAKTKNVCAVGDDDQSIYAFRGSDPVLLVQFEKDFPGTKRVILNENYRSSYGIVSAANRIIVQNKQRYQKEMNARFTNHKLPVLFFPYDEEEEATMIVTDIQEKISAGAKPGDVAILYRTHTGSRAVFERLANSSLPFKIDQDVESFYERFIVKGMLSFLALNLNEDNQNAIRNIFPALFVKQSFFSDIKAESILKDCSMLESLSAVKTGFPFQDRKLGKLVPVIRSLSGLSPLTAIETVEQELGYQDFIKNRGNEGNKWDKGSDDIRDLKVVAKSFSSLKDFLDHCRHMTSMNQEIKQLSKQQTNAVTLSTIHRAKGLEYKFVYVLGAVDGSLPHDHALDSLRKGDAAPLEEERRLLYVAATRAMEELFLSAPEKRRGRKAAPSRFLSAISTIRGNV